MQELKSQSALQEPLYSRKLEWKRKKRTQWLQRKLLLVEVPNRTKRAQEHFFRNAVLYRARLQTKHTRMSPLSPLSPLHEGYTCRRQSARTCTSLLYSYQTEISTSFNPIRNEVFHSHWVVYIMKKKLKKILLPNNATFIFLSFSNFNISFVKEKDIHLVNFFSHNQQ